MQISFALQDTKDSFYNPFSLRIDAPAQRWFGTWPACVSSLELGHGLLPELLCLKLPLPCRSREYKHRCLCCSIAAALALLYKPESATTLSGFFPQFCSTAPTIGSSDALSVAACVTRWARMN